MMTETISNTRWTIEKYLSRFHAGASKNSREGAASVPTVWTLTACMVTEIVYLRDGRVGTRMDEWVSQRNRQTIQQSNNGNRFIRRARNADEQTKVEGDVALEALLTETRIATYGRCARITREIGCRAARRETRACGLAGSWLMGCSHARTHTGIASC